VCAFEFLFADEVYQSISATASHHHKETTSPEVRATIAASKDDVSIRISDQGAFLFHTILRWFDQDEKF